MSSSDDPPPYSAFPVVVEARNNSVFPLFTALPTGPSNFYLNRHSE